jgi:hypothetical protein
MTINTLRHHVIDCDECRDYTNSYDDGHKQPQTLRAFIKECREMGWIVNTDKTLCPECNRKIKR